MKFLSLLMVALAAVLFCGCNSVRDLDRAKEVKLDDEGSVVFTRPAHYTMFFGSYSISQFLEVIYERASYNAAGQMVVEVGIRNRGPVSWTNWPVHAPKVLRIKAQTNFYAGKRVSSPIVYSTNRPTLVIGRGETYAYKVTCPVAGVTNYQLVLGD